MLLQHPLVLLYYYAKDDEADRYEYYPAGKEY